MIYENPLNLKIFDLISDLFAWPIEPNSSVELLGLDESFYQKLEEALFMRVRDVDYRVVAPRDAKTVADLVGALDAQYTQNYFKSENGTYKGLITVDDHTGRPVDSIKHKWRLRGKNLIDRIQKMQSQDPQLKILDIGCGYNMYKDYLNNVTGVDPYIEDADILCRIEDFDPPQKYDIIICFGPMNWYTYDLQVRNMNVIKRSLAPEGICFWSHVHNYYKVYQLDAARAHKWIADDLSSAFRNNAFYFYDRLWKYNQYFNWTEEALERISKQCGLKTGDMQYDDCGCYRPPMWRLFCELSHAEI